MTSDIGFQIDDKTFTLNETSAAAAEAAAQRAEAAAETLSGSVAQIATNTQDITALKEDISHIGGLSEDIKQAMLQIATKVAYIDEHGQDYYDALYDALYPTAYIISISVVYTQSGTVYDTDTLDSLKSDLVVTAHMSDHTTRTVTEYTLSGTLAEGTSVVTVAYGGKTTTFSVTVTAEKYYYDLNDGLTVLNGGIVPSAKFGIPRTEGEIVIDYFASVKRRAFVTGIEAPRALKATTIENPYPEDLSDSVYYPIKIPRDATGVTVSITPASQIISIYAYDYDETNHYTSDYVTGKSQTGWANGTGSLSFSAGEYQYITVCSKYNNAGSSYPTEPTALTVTFTTA